MKAGKETEMYNQGYMDGFDDAVKSEIEKVTPKLKDVKEKSFPKDEPDYWESLKHQYAGMAMQSLVEKYFTASREVYAEIHVEKDRIYKEHATALAEVCDIFASALVEKMKEKEERK